jgi:hypothetical protein
MKRAGIVSPAKDEATIFKRDMKEIGPTVKRLLQQAHLTAF